MKGLSRFILWLLTILLVLAIFGIIWIFYDLPAVISLPQRLNTPSVSILDRYGRLLYEVLPEEGGRHTTVPLEQIPLALRQATIATEDRSFYSHPGVDILGVLRAAWINLRGGDTLAGGSTITQQVARNLLLDAEERSERSVRRKIREMILAWYLTQRYSKDEILALYLNQMYYGGLAYGVEAASRTYFGKSVSHLDLAECALLAGLPQSPALYNPYTDFEAAKQRQKIVLGLMQQQGYISLNQRLMAENEPLVLNETPYPIEAPHFVMMVRSELDELFTPEELYTLGGLVVRTTLNLDWQKHGENAVSRQIESLKHSPDGLGHNVNSAAMVAIDPHTGDVLALVGSPDFFDAQNGGAINMAISPRQPGSALKPILYAVVLDPERPGGAWTAATMLLDVRTSFVTQDGKAYTPENYDLLEYGPVLLRQALGSSLNIPAVITLDYIGLADLFALTRKLGITTLNDPQAYDLSLALGGGDVNLLELTAAYGAFANGGFRVKPRYILEIEDLQGNVLYVPSEQEQERVLDARVAWLISDILSDNDARLIGFGANSILRLDRPAAVKTGTTSNFHDNWTIGYTPSLVVGVWSGNTNFEPMRDVNGLTGAAPVWHQFMRTVLSGKPEEPFLQPEGFVRLEICALSGMLPTADCPYHRLEWFIEGTQPVEADTFYRSVIIDTATGLLADNDTPPERRQARLALDLPAQAHPWARAQGLLLYADLQAAFELSSNNDASPSFQLRLLSPPAGSVYRLSPNLPASAQRIRIEAVGKSGLQRVTLWIDGFLLASFENTPYLAWWELTPGIHQVWAEAVDDNGQKIVSEKVNFTVEAAP